VGVTGVVGLLVAGGFDTTGEDEPPPPQATRAADVMETIVLGMTDIGITFRDWFLSVRS
jgi:hypothetical protein